MITPKIRGFICTNADPDGCAHNVSNMFERLSGRSKVDGVNNALIIGASQGFGLASRVTAAVSGGANTLGVFFERMPDKGKSGGAGYYNNEAFERLARERGLYAGSINGDCFSDEVKDEAVKLIKSEMGKIDLIVYSIGAPRRTHPKTGDKYSSVIKPIGGSFSQKTIDVMEKCLSTVTIEPATDEEIASTINVMGGEDWYMWIEALSAAGVLSDNAVTVAYSYIGPSLTHPIYRDGTIGLAKKDVDMKAAAINEDFSGVSAYVSVNKALVTQSSAAIPVVPLYISILYAVMKKKGIHEDTLDQMYRLFADRLYTGGNVPVDEAGYIRLDDWEMRADVQEEVSLLWNKVNQDNLLELTDLDGYTEEFLSLFGFSSKKC